MVTGIGTEERLPAAPDSRGYILRSALAYSGTNLFGQTATVVSGFILRRILPPGLMGVWNLAQVVRGYVQAISLGSLSGAMRELPILRGRGDGPGQVRARSVVLWYSIAEASVVVLAVWAYGVLRGSVFGLPTFALIVTGLLVIIGELQAAYTTFFQGAQLYIVLSRVLLFSSLAYAIALPTGAWIGGVDGLLAAAIAAELARGLWSAYAGHRSGVTVAPTFDWGVWRRLVSFGMGFRIADYPQTVFLSLDLLWVSRGLGLSALGVYAFAKSFYTQSTDVTTRIGTVLFTRTLWQHGGGVDRDKIARDMLRFIQFQQFISIPLVCWATAAAAPVLIRHITPLYAGSIPVLLILLPGAFFISQNNNIYALWIADKRLISYGLSNVIGVAATAGGIAAFWFRPAPRTLLEVAAGTVAGYVGYFVYMVLTVGREMWGLGRCWAVLGRAGFAAAWTAGVLQIFAAANASPGGWTHDLLRAAGAAVLGLLALAPLMAIGVWLTGTWPDLRRALGWLSRAGAARPA